MNIKILEVLIDFSRKRPGNKWKFDISFNVTH